MAGFAVPQSQCDMRWGSGHKNDDGTHGHLCQLDMFHWENHQCKCGQLKPVHIERDYVPDPMRYYNSPTSARNHQRYREEYPKWNTTKKRWVHPDGGSRAKRREQG